MSSTVLWPLPIVGTLDAKPERRPLFSRKDALLLAQTEDRLLRHEYALYLADVHGVAVEAMR